LVNFLHIHSSISVEIIHLDVKCANFHWVDEAAGGETVKLVNFDNSLILKEGQTSLKIPPSMRHHSWDYLHGPELFIHREGAMVGWCWQKCRITQNSNYKFHKIKNY
jgi:hypothetical protein